MFPVRSQKEPGAAEEEEACHTSSHQLCGEKDLEGQSGSRRSRAPRHPHGGPGDPCAADAAPLRSARPLASPCSGSASPSPSCPLPPLLPLRAEQTRKRENGASLPGSLRGDAV